MFLHYELQVLWVICCLIFLLMHSFWVELYSYKLMYCINLRWIVVPLEIWTAVLCSHTNGNSVDILKFSQLYWISVMICIVTFLARFYFNSILCYQFMTENQSSCSYLLSYRCWALSSLQLHCTYPHFPYKWQNCNMTSRKLLLMQYFRENMATIMHDEQNKVILLILLLHA